MKQINSYIKESEIVDISEKLSLGDAIFRFISKTIFKLDTKTQSDVLKMIAKFMEEHSDGQVKTNLIKLKDLESNLNNCINKNDRFLYKDDKFFTFGDAIKTRNYWSNIELIDDTLFVCFYNKDNKNKFYAWDESPSFFTAKDKKGRRPLMGYPELDPDNKLSYGYRLVNYVIPRVIDPEKWEEEQKEKKAKEQDEEKKNVKKHIENLEKELNELKKLLKDK